MCTVSCPYLHRNNGDTERNYHPRYYKTEMCFHVTRGGCIRGQNCIYAHSDDDIREPVYDVTERSNPAAAAAEIEKIAIENGHQTYPKSYGKFYYFFTAGCYFKVLYYGTVIRTASSSVRVKILFTYVFQQAKVAIKFLLSRPNAVTQIVSGGFLLLQISHGLYYTGICQKS